MKSVNKAAIDQVAYLVNTFDGAWERITDLEPYMTDSEAKCIREALSALFEAVTVVEKRFENEWNDERKQKVLDSFREMPTEKLELLFRKASELVNEPGNP